MKVVGYADRLSVRPGEKIKFMVSCKASSYQADIVKLIHGDPNPKGPGFKEKLIRTPVNGEHPGHAQAIRSGSYAIVGDSPLLACPRGFTLQAWVYPTTPTKGVQGLLTKWLEADGSGYGLAIEADGSAALWVGGKGRKPRKLTSGKALQPRRWYFIATTFDAATGKATLYQLPLIPWPIDDSQAEVKGSLGAGSASANTAAFLMAGYWGSAARKPSVTGHFNGKIESPAVYSRALDRSEIESLRNGAAASSIGDGLVAAWDFSLDISSRRITDTSQNRLHGETMHMPTRAMTGHNWTGDNLDFKVSSGEYGAIHFHDDDLEDAGWDVGFELTVPDSLTSGLYAARLRTGDGEDYVPFYVRAKPGKTAKILYLAPTNSYLSYANEQIMNSLAHEVRAIINLEGSTYPSQPQDRYVVENRLLSQYDLHSDGSGVAYSSRLRPIVNMRPKYNMPILNNGKGSPHQFNADLHIVDWLEAMGHHYDVATDEDLHLEGLSALSPYNVVMTGSHPEYWSTQMLDALEAFLAAGGRLMYLGGNGFYWIISYALDAPHVMEVRRWGGTGSWKAQPGEYFHSTTGELGGVWRNRNRAPQKMLGVGFTAQGNDHNAPYRREKGSFDPRAAFIFKGVGKDELIGDFDCLVQEYGAAGHEMDRYDLSLGTPSHALLLASSFGHTDGYQHVIEEVLASGSPEGGTKSPLVRADMVYFEGPNGGAVFSTGSIAWCGSLFYNNYDNNVSRITDNVLRRFASDDPIT